MQATLYTPSSIEVTIQGITLMSVEEFSNARAILPSFSRRWWLQSPGNLPDRVMCVRDGYYLTTCETSNSSIDVKPMLLLNGVVLQTGDKIHIFGYLWTAVSDHAVLCDSSVGHAYFQKGYGASAMNDYKCSSIKRWLEKWLENQIRKCA